MTRITSNFNVAWLDGVPVVTTVEVMGDGNPSIIVETKDDSLKIMWAWICAYREQSE